MSREEIVIAAGGAVALVLVILLAIAFVLLARLRREVADLRSREGSTPSPAAQLPETTEATYVIASIPGDGPEDDRVEHVVAQPIDGRLFTDIVARETVVKAGGLLHGLRRALDPETRNRIRFEMKRELKRARKQRRADVKSAVREANARARAEQGVA